MKKVLPSVAFMKVALGDLSVLDTSLPWDEMKVKKNIISQININVSLNRCWHRTFPTA